MNNNQHLDISFNPFLDDADDGLETDLPESSSHPLKSAGLAVAPVSAGITRPHLARLLSPGSDDSELDGDIPNDAETHPDEKVVLVHEISSKDSLAGVALKYNISMAALRRANQLWSSDSIHLRKVLYIPIETPPQPNAATAAEPSDTLRSKIPDNSTIRRIPASQLSYFPPSKSEQLSQPEVLDADASFPAHPKHTRYASSPPPSLNSIFSALPIAPSTRDTIIARLSFESSRSTLSDEDHELADVNSRRAPEDGASWGHSQRTPRFRSSSPTTAKPTGGSSPPSPTSRTGIQNISNREQGQPLYQPDTCAPSSLPTHIRSVQLEPTPGMKLPLPTGSSSRNPSGMAKQRTRLDAVSFDPPLPAI